MFLTFFLSLFVSVPLHASKQQTVLFFSHLVAKLIDSKHILPLLQLSLLSQHQKITGSLYFYIFFLIFVPPNPSEVHLLLFSSSNFLQFFTCSQFYSPPLRNLRARALESFSCFICSSLQELPGPRRTRRGQGERKRRGG